MQDITVKRVTLLDELKKNRDRHRTVLHDAMLGYRQQAMLELREQLAKLEAGVVPSDLGVSLTRPASHTADYDRVIGMIEMHTGDEIELDETSYSWYVMDQWAWQRGWRKLSSSYAAQSVITNYGSEES